MKTFLKYSEFVFSAVLTLHSDNTVQYLLANLVDRFEPGSKGRSSATPPSKREAGSAVATLL
jgi:hypothetical protein